ncbi:autotransporter assembly complex protein TamA [Ideonella paludis]|uniref:BamA/TamA family outer membrane protein n=1 Tax=Ideonella paludis TaxID=1233411 RepID=A0ABS5DXA6_9BURK|nr:BamA/TamA family outer membrane protein [Ideonella paludis]MBQ0935783.1 BamA/TamA family outer membrane protein [Ideonella paludis]
MSRWAPLAALLMALGLSACASLGDMVAPGSAAAPLSPEAAASAAQAAARRPQLEIEADSALKPVLLRSLDLARAVASPDADTINELEWARLIAVAPEQAQQALQTEGLFEAQVRVERASESPLRLKLIVTPGEPVRVGRLTLEVQGELADLAEAGDATAQALKAKLQAQWPLKPGVPLRMSDWADAKNAVLALLRAQGYASASWAGTGAQIDPAQRESRLFLVADSGPLYRAGGIDVEGLFFHQLDRIQALADLPPGSPLTEAALLDYQLRLTKTGLFDQATVTLDPDPALAAQARVKVTVKEAPIYTTTLSLGYSSDGGPRTVAEHLVRRLLDKPIQMSNKLEWARDAQSWTGALSTHLNGHFDRDILGPSYARRSDLDLTETSHRLRVGRSHERTEFERLIFAEVERSEVCLDQANGVCLSTQAFSLNTHYTWRRLDSVLLPTEGYALQLQAGMGWSVDKNGTDNSRNKGLFGRLYARAIGYWPLGGLWTSQARLELGAAASTNDVSVPLSQLFWAGGDDSVRGYPSRGLGGTSVGPLEIGSNLLATASVELAHPFTAKLPSVQWAAFIDGGRAGDSVADLRPALGYGLGLRWRSPVGPLKVDWAWGEERRRGRLHLSLGVNF